MALSLILFAAVIGGLVWFGGKNGRSQTATINNEASGGILTVKEINYDFGDVGIKNGLIDHEYILENASDKMVKIGEVSTSCMCTSAEIKTGDKKYGPFGMPGHSGASRANIIVNSGEKIIVKATFDPAAHGPAGIGMVERAIFIDTGAAEPLTLTFKVNVTP
ncbi:MAG: hypothetical protein UV48_C0026G0006 [Candidatus Azambacteria bacterium GW2011_GWA2_42_9]|nr:MAG: hypothetical protein UV48_C0026G0006 [Candidatus Azambacteria bacterium GW2011_GWA2_42_9]KKS87763.1 MAG: hypothetical protein UV62_C0027G0006 [Parcubacteria group bacterium GW2011_GWC1_43_11]